MSDFDNRVTSSDVGAFKQSGEIRTDSITISGTVASGAEKEVVSSGITVENLDFNEVTFDNSAKHSGKFHNMNEGVTFVFDNTDGIDYAFELQAKVVGDMLIFRAWVLNTTTTVLSLQTTTINFRYVPYEATI